MNATTTADLSKGQEVAALIQEREQVTRRLLATYAWADRDRCQARLDAIRQRLLTLGMGGIA